MSGWICSYRAIWEHPIFKGKAERVGVWDWMLKTAAWKETRFNVGSEVITLERGQLCVAQRQVSDATGMGRQSFRTFLRLLEAEGAIQICTSTKSTQSRTLITICKYDVYQVQQPKANPEPTQSQPTKEQVNNIPVGTAEKSAVVDPAKIMFDSGLNLLVEAGVPEIKARGIIGKWKKQAGVSSVIEAISRAKREGAIEPVSFIEGCLKWQAKPEAKRFQDLSPREQALALL